MKRNYFICLLMLANLAFTLRLSAQAPAPASKEVAHHKLMWFDLFENINIKKWKLQAEATERFFIDTTAHFNAGVRVYGMYKVGAGWSIGPGFSVWFPHLGNTTTHELRPAQQFLYTQDLKHLRFAHRFVAEERFIRNVVNGEVADGYAFFMRFRYRFAFEDTLARYGPEKDRTLKLLVNDEIFLQAGEKVVTNVFDQNRFFVGVSVEFAKNTSITVGYLNLFRPTSQPGKFDDIHIFRVYFTHEFSLGKKK